MLPTAKYRGRENALPCAYKSSWMASNENRKPPIRAETHLESRDWKKSDKHVTTWSLTVRHWKVTGPQKEKKNFQASCFRGELSVKLRGVYLTNWLMTEDFVKHSNTIKHSNIHHDSSFCRNDPDFGAPRVATTPDCLKQFRPAKFRSNLR